MPIPKLPESTRVVLRGAVWGVVAAILTSLAEVVGEPFKTLILSGLLPLIVMVSKTTPTSVMLPTTVPAARVTDPPKE